MIPEDPAEATRLHGRLNYRLCTAVDLTKLGMVLDEMVTAGLLHRAAASTLDHQAHSLLAALRNANDQAFGREPSPPIR